MAVSSEVILSPGRVVVKGGRYAGVHGVHGVHGAHGAHGPGAPGHGGELPPPYSEQPPHTIIRETIIVQPPLKDGPMLFPCPSCRKRVMTRVQYVNTRKTHMMAGFICGFTLWCLLCCLAAIPYVVSTFKKVEHYCSECNLFLGEYTKM